jgi:hypothetical protein
MSLRPLPAGLSRGPEVQRVRDVARRPVPGHVQVRPARPEPGPAARPVRRVRGPGRRHRQLRARLDLPVPRRRRDRRVLRVLQLREDPICQPEGDFCVGATCQTCTWSFCDSPCDPLDPPPASPTRSAARRRDLDSASPTRAATRASTATPASSSTPATPDSSASTATAPRLRGRRLLLHHLRHHRPQHLPRQGQGHHLQALVPGGHGPHPRARRPSASARCEHAPR